MANGAEHVPDVAPLTTVQAIPLGVELIDPDPVALAVNVAMVKSKRATTVRAVDMVSEQVVVPAHAPSQPAKRLPAFAVALNATVLPSTNDALHALMALPDEMTHPMPPGVDSTLPDPLPAPVTVSGCCGTCARSNRAVSPPLGGTAP
jgi:hypothetical protein